MIVNEITILKKLNHPNIVELVDYIKISEFYYLLFGICKGSLYDFLISRCPDYPISNYHIVTIVGQLLSAVNYMHSFDPPIIHRDIKFENMLISYDGRLRLCDFGSCTTKFYNPTADTSLRERQNMQEELNKNTTLRYRAPEIIDIYCNLIVNYNIDTWAIGCIIFNLLYGVHPFELEENLAIINIKYRIPRGINITDHITIKFINIYKEILVKNPESRPHCSNLLKTFNDIAGSINTKIHYPIFTQAELANLVSSDPKRKMNNPDQNPNFMSKFKDQVNKLAPGVKKVENFFKNSYDNKIKPLATDLKNKVTSLQISNSNLNDPIKNNNLNIDKTPHVHNYFRRLVPRILVSTTAKLEQQFEILKNIYTENNVLVISIDSNRPDILSSYNFKTIDYIAVKTHMPFNLKDMAVFVTQIINFLEYRSENILFFLSNTKNEYAICFFASTLFVYCKIFQNFYEAFYYCVLKLINYKLVVNYLPPLVSMNRYLVYLLNYTNFLKNSRDESGIKNSNSFSFLSDLNLFKHGMPSEVVNNAPNSAQINIEPPKLRAIHVKQIKIKPVYNFKLVFHSSKCLLEIYSGGMLRHKSTDYDMNDDAVIFTIGITLVGDISIDVYIQHESTNQLYFSCNFHSSFVSDTKELNFPSEELDLGQHQYKTELKNWSLGLDLYPITLGYYPPIWDPNTVNLKDSLPSTIFGANKNNIRLNLEKTTNNDLNNKIFNHISKLSGSNIRYHSPSPSKKLNPPPIRQPTLMDSSRSENTGQKTEDLLGLMNDENTEMMGDKLSHKETNIDNINSNIELINLDDDVESSIFTHIDTDLLTDDFLDPVFNFLNTDQNINGFTPKETNTLSLKDKSSKGSSSVENDAGTISEFNPNLAHIPPSLIDFMEFPRTNSNNFNTNAPKSMNMSNDAFILDFSDKNKFEINDKMFVDSPKVSDNKKSTDLIDLFGVTDGPFEKPLDSTQINPFVQSTSNDIFSVSSKFYSTQFGTSNLNPLYTNVDIQQQSNFNQPFNDYLNPPSKISSNNLNNFHTPGIPNYHNNIDNKVASNSNLLNTDNNVINNIVFSNNSSSQNWNNKQFESNITTINNIRSQSNFSTLSNLNNKSNNASVSNFTNIPHVSSTTNLLGNSMNKPSHNAKVSNNLSNSGLGYRDDFSNLVKSISGKPQEPATVNKLSLNEVKQMQIEHLESDPIKKKINEWSGTKQKNIKNLLLTLHTVLWPEVTGWIIPVSYKLNNPKEVKFYYNLACRLTHPDKMIGKPNAELAKAIFVELNEAWNYFVASGNKNF